MKQLYSICTPYQLIVAIQMKNSLYPNDEADIIINDHFVNFDKVAKNLKEIGLFRNVYISYSKKDFDIVYSNRLKHIIEMFFYPELIVKRCCDLKDFLYDSLYFYNLIHFNKCLYYLLKSNNSCLVCERFEEGYGSMIGNIGIVNSNSFEILIRKWTKKPSIKMIKCINTFNPNLSCLSIDYNLKKIPKIKKTKHEIVDVFNEVFDYTQNERFDRKYIFFEESYFADGIDIDDVELVLKVANLVGKENLMVKLHPRNPIDRFTELGIKTTGQSGCPWEVIVMNHDFSNNVFLTIASGSVLSPRIIFDDNISTFMLYNCTKILSPMLQKENFQKFIEKFRSKYGQNGFYIPESFDHFRNILRRSGL